MKFNEWLESQKLGYVTMGYMEQMEKAFKAGKEAKKNEIIEMLNGNLCAVCYMRGESQSFCSNECDVRFTIGMLQDVICKNT